MVRSLFFCPFLILLTACQGGSPQPETCTQLFGVPTPNTGLSSADCTGSCECGSDPWTPPSYTDADLMRIESLEHLNPSELLLVDPYEESVPEVSAESVCAVELAPGDMQYTLQSFESADAANSAGATVTHTGTCGLCSSLKNLAVYMRNPDLTDPVRDCGIKGMLEGEEANIECLMDIGFDEPCAQIWYFNTKHTRELCLEVCMSALDSPHHQPDGTLNDCIQCDEDESGPIFKAISGRTRRNSGLPSGLCRPCDSVSRVDHASY